MSSTADQMMPTMPPPYFRPPPAAGQGTYTITGHSTRGPAHEPTPPQRPLWLSLLVCRPQALAQPHSPRWSVQAAGHS